LSEVRQNVVIDDSKFNRPPADRDKQLGSNH